MPAKIKLHPDLQAKLRGLRLRVETADPDTLVLKNVPASPQCFNKATTNLLIKRFDESLPCAVCVDDNLSYTGAVPMLARAFASGVLQNGWRVLTFGGSLHTGLPAALEYALDFLGADGASGEPAANPATPGKSLLAAWAEDLTQAVRRAKVGRTLYRDEEIEHVATCVLGWQGRLPLVLGPPGAGKTNLLYGVARVLQPRQRSLLSVNVAVALAGTLFESERESLLASLLREAKNAGAVLALEQTEWLAASGPPRAAAMIRDALDAGARIIATAAADSDSPFAVPPLASRLETVQLRELCADEACQVLKELRPLLERHHRVRIDDDVEQAAVERSLSMAGCLPGKAVGLMDAAAARARLTGSTAATLMDVYLAASRMVEGA